MLRLAVLVACFNRREKTLAALAAVQAQVPADWSLTIYLFDDGSTDGTGDAVRARFPDAVILQGDGQQYWNRSMHAAFDRALRDRHALYLWLNDDTLLDADALAILVEAWQQACALGPAPIIVGATRDPATGRVSYGGGLRPAPAWRPFFYALCTPDGRLQAIDAINGNCVLIPQAVAEQVGNLDPVFQHGMGDTDYGFRAARLGVPLYLAPRFIGECRRNPVAGSVHDRSLGLRERWRVACSRKGLPPRSWWRLCRRHGGLLALVHFTWGYLHVLIGR